VEVDMDLLKEELKVKHGKVIDFIRNNNLDGIILSKLKNFAWYTGGKDVHGLVMSDEGLASLVVTEDKTYLVCNNVEKQRMIDEIINNTDIEIIYYPWYKSDLSSTIAKIKPNAKLASDSFIPGAISINPDFEKLKYSLSQNEIEKYRWLGRESATCLEEVAKSIKVGDTDWSMEAKLKEKVSEKGMTPVVILAGTDERVLAYKHPYAIGRKVEKYTMLVLMASRWGLMVAATRIVSLKPLSEEIRKRHDSAMKVDAALILNTKPGVKAGDVLKKGIEVYESEGFKDEWKEHFQGGPTGYNIRDYFVTPDTEEIIQENQPFAWNPSIKGTKSEDTILVGKSENEIITHTGDWPSKIIEIDGKKIKRHEILVK
jgi:Xaa-Pro dipeptidase